MTNKEDKKGCDVVFYEAFSEEEQLLKELLPPDVNVLFYSKTIQEQGCEEPPAALVSIRTQSEVPESWAPKIKGILTRSTGYDHVARYRWIAHTVFAIGYLPRYCARAVAEHAVLVTMALFRKLPQQVKQFRHFDRDGITGREALGKKLLVVGVGSIGGEIVDIARGIGMEVKGVDIAPKKKDVAYVSLEEGIAWAQCVICAMPLTAETQGLLNYSLFAKAAHKIIFVNIARGEISPTEDLQKLLEEGLLAGLGLDVFEDESGLAEALRKGDKDASSPAALIKELQNKSNVVLTPHNAFNTFEAVRRKTEQSVSAVMSFLQQGVFPDSIPE